jgi:hypothetical protein
MAHTKLKKHRLVSLFRFCFLWFLLLINGSEMPACSGVAPLTGGKIVTAERPLTIVAAHAALGAGSCMMIQRRGRCNLPSLWHSRSHLMAFVATNFLMFAMTKAHAESSREFRSAAVAA